MPCLFHYASLIARNINGFTLTRSYAHNSDENQWRDDIVSGP